ncbi:DUF2787 domain-containing protein [Vibrio crassostreae]|nr:DUF2787 domain-containing protein [Vibrio crassostreae]CAK2011280.1 DUF2787 domain-containing protein [Vibrio crassostreae]CAK2013833.1 DUF2787 domain-containing protein [Vibrio crassostreae]CAK2018469.1 DUF2787 domain-containing protein [Vibrio crassostreae]CAK2020074.1 DUF2787 domain-containing protein [Vibrio crassostreae]
MKLCFSKNKLTLPVSVDLQDTLNRVITDSGKWIPMIQSVVFSFRQKSYSPENGGYHPVEVRITRLNDQWVFDYITDFSYCGLMPELEKEIDFDFGHGVAYIRYMGEVSITEPSVAEFYSMWETNFLSYIGIDCFDEVKVTVD